MIENKIFIKSPNFKYESTVTKTYIGVKSSAEINIDVHPTNGDGVPRRVFPRNLTII